jgi:hypothetical protein
MVRYEGQDAFRLRPRSKWAEVLEVEVAVAGRAGRAREAREIIRRLTRRGDIGAKYRPMRQYRFDTKTLAWLGVICDLHRRAVCCNRKKGGARA